MKSRFGMGVCFCIMMFAFAGCSSKAVSDIKAPTEKESSDKAEFFDVKQEDIRCEGNIFYYNGQQYDISEQSELINGIVLCETAGKDIVIGGHVNPNVIYYLLFDTQTETFVKTFYGGNLIWRDDDITTAVYSQHSSVCDYDGNILKTFDLQDSEYIDGLAFAEDDTELFVTITDDGQERTEVLKRIPKRLP